MSIVFKIGGTDITNYVVDVSGLEFRRDVSNKIIIPHPVFILDEDCSVSLDDVIDMYVDSTIKFRCYVSKIKTIAENKKEVQAWDLIKKLDKHYVANITDNEWSGSYSHSMAEYKQTYGGSTYWDENYYSVLFALRLFIWKAADYSFSNVDVTAIATSDSGYKRDDSGTDHNLKYKELLFQSWQMRDFGKSNSTDPYYESMTLLEVFQETMKVLNLGYSYNGSKIEIDEYSSYSLPANNISYVYDKDTYISPDEVVIKNKVMTDLADYLLGYTSSDLTEDSVTYPSSVSAPKESKSYKMPNQFQIHCIGLATYRIEHIEDTSNNNFIEQYAPKHYNKFDNNYKYKLETDMEVSNDVHSNLINFSNKRSVIEYIR